MSQDKEKKAEAVKASAVAPAEKEQEKKTEEAPKAEAQKAAPKVVLMERKGKMLTVKFMKAHTLNIGGVKTEYVKGDKAEVELHTGNLLSQRNIATII